MSEDAFMPVLSLAARVKHEKKTGYPDDVYTAVQEILNEQRNGRDWSNDDVAHVLKKVKMTPVDVELQHDTLARIRDICRLVLSVYVCVCLDVCGTHMCIMKHIYV